MLLSSMRRAREILACFSLAQLPRRICREDVISRRDVRRVARVSALRAAYRDGSERARLERSSRSVVIKLAERISMRVRESLGVLDNKGDRRQGGGYLYEIR